jgi:hypothetical protein
MSGMCRLAVPPVPVVLVGIVDMAVIPTFPRPIAAAMNAAGQPFVLVFVAAVICVVLFVGAPMFVTVPTWVFVGASVLAVPVMTVMAVSAMP